jgi:acyl-CoA thioesterase
MYDKTVKEVKAEIDRAVETGDGGLVGQYLEDERPSVSKYAHDALHMLAKSQKEDKTPAPQQVTSEEKISQEEVNAVKEQVGAAVNYEDAVSATPSEQKPVNRKGWIPATQKDLDKWQAQGVLIGYDPDMELALIKK